MKIWIKILLEIYLKLLKWTGNRWVITLSKEIGQKTFSANQAEIKKKLA